jgi:hypothetical protein
MYRSQGDGLAVISQWHHLAVSVVGDQASFFLDGLKIGVEPDMFPATLSSYVLDNPAYSHKIGGDGFEGFVYKFCVSNYAADDFVVDPFPSDCTRYQTEIDGECAECPDSSCECVRTSDCRNCEDDLCETCGSYATCDKTDPNCQGDDCPRECVTGASWDTD